jgi:FkbM family methyltransferase
MQVPGFDNALWTPSPFLLKRFRRRFWRQLLSRVGPRYTLKHVSNQDMIVDLRDLQGVSKEILKEGLFEEFACDLAKKWIRPDSQVIDIGANIGFWSVHCAQQTSNTVYAFEPDAKNVELLRANVAINQCSNVQIVPKACGIKAEPLNLYRSSTNYGDHQMYRSQEAREATNVQVCRIDDEIGVLKNLSFVKIDVQGFEEWALRGLAENLKAARDVVVLCEFWPQGMANAGSNPDVFLDWMADLGFQFQVIPHLSNTVLSMPRSQLYQLCAGGKYADLVFARS